MCSIDDAVRQLRQGPAHLAHFDFENALLVGIRAGWDAFQTDGDRHTQLQETLRNLAVRLKPFWAKVSFYGRQRTARVLTEDQVQCLQFAGLLDHPPSKNVIAWWDDLGSTFRAFRDDQRIAVGREGERRTLEHERKRLRKLGVGKEPIWVSIEDNGAGFDVLSYDPKADGGLEELQIEVKAASYSPLHFTLTRNEWTVAARSCERHLFHIWNLDTGDLTTLTVLEMESHIPVDRGKGTWGEVTVNLKT